MNYTSRNSLRYFCLWLAFVASPSRMAFAAAPPIVHQIALPDGQSWCDDGMINGLFTTVNAFRSTNGNAPLNMSALGMKDAEMRASQVPGIIAANPPGTPAYDPHLGYDTLAASLGYNIVSENLAWITTNPSYIVYTVWQDPSH